MTKLEKAIIQYRAATKAIIEAMTEAEHFESWVDGMGDVVEIDAETIYINRDYGNEIIPDITYEGINEEFEYD